MAVLPLDGRSISALVALVLIEGLFLVIWRARTGAGVPVAGTVANLLAGGSLLLALRAALTSASPLAIAVLLVVALVAHLADLASRWEIVAPRPNGKVGVPNS